MKNKVLCEICGAEIPAMRLKMLPDTTTCVKCSQTKPYSMHEVLGTGPAEEYKINEEDFENEEMESDADYEYGE